jgi:hypothetical protein
MAVHETCQDEKEFDPERTCIGTALIAVRCKMIGENRCQGDGLTGSSLYSYCKGCSEYYNICERCGEEFTEPHPKAEVSHG